MEDFYEILGVKSSATQADIKKAFRKLSKEYHPDVEGGDTEKFQKLNEAYQTLSDETKRRAYDRGTSIPTIPRPTVNNIVIRIPWTLENIKKGLTHKFVFERAVTCQTCHGVGSTVAGAVTICKICKGHGVYSRTIQTLAGMSYIQTSCTTCNGTGEVNTNPCSACKGQKQQVVQVTEDIIIPANTINLFVAPGKGHKIVQGTSDLIIGLVFYDREGIALSYDGILQKELTVNFFDAILGHSSEVTIGDTKIKVTIPKEAKDGQMLRLSKAYCNLDVIIHLNIRFPTIKDLNTFVKGLFEGSEIIKDVEKILENKLS